MPATPSDQIDNEGSDLSLPKVDKSASFESAAGDAATPSDPIDPIDNEGIDLSPPEGDESATVDAVTPPPSAGISRRILAAFAVAIVVTMGGVLAIVWSSEPDTFDVQALMEIETGLAASDVAPGAFTTSALIGVAKTLLEKPGGYLRNDIMPPTLVLDNMPSWERGVVIELRDTIRALRDDFSRAQTQSPEDLDLVRADAQFHFDDVHWILPATENEFSTGVEALSRYLTRLHAKGPERSRFHVRADNLNFYLSTVEKRLGSYAQQLAGNVFSRNYESEPESDPQGASTMPVTPWLEVDNVFYEARGYSWALLHTLRGIEKDFAAVMVAKAADASLRQIIKKLQETQATIWSPMILNNSGFGIFTNHSLVMASYISRANAAIIDLRMLISEG